MALAAEHGDAKEVRRLMKDEGVNPDTVFTKDGLPLVAWPVFTENPAGLKAMLENGADPNARVPTPLVVRYKDGSVGTYYKNNAMVWAARADDPIYLKLLLDHGGDPNTRNSNDETLLLQAKFSGTWENIELLVERGADVNALSQQRAFLDEYAGLGSFVRTLWLLEHGAKPTKHRSTIFSGTPATPKSRSGNATASNGCCNTAMSARRSCRRPTANYVQPMAFRPMKKTSPCCNRRGSTVCVPLKS